MADAARGARRARPFDGGRGSPLAARPADRCAASSPIVDTPDVDETTAPAPGGRTTTGIAFDDEGSGEPILLLHAGVADRRMWAPQVPAFSAHHRVIRPDARGFGESLPPGGPWSHHTDVLALLDELLVARAHVVGASMGAGIAVETALARPDAVASLVLAAPGGALLGDAPPELRPIWAAEVDALDRGDLDAAVEVNLKGWVDGPSRPPDAVDATVREFVARMQREAFELPEWDPETAPEHELSPPASERFAEIRCPVLVLVGEEDQPAVIATAERIATEAPVAQLVVWPGVAHMLTLEHPAEFTTTVLEFLAGVEAVIAARSRPADR
jgi:3-oxoadipate enol-lactonase